MGQHDWRAGLADALPDTLALTGFVRAAKRGGDSGSGSSGTGDESDPSAVPAARVADPDESVAARFGQLDTEGVEKRPLIERARNAAVAARKDILDANPVLEISRGLSAPPSKLARKPAQVFGFNLRVRTMGETAGGMALELGEFR
nr:hypothetical protein [Thiocystis violascens]